MKKRKDGLYEKVITLPNGKRKHFYSSESSEKKAEKDIQQQLIVFSAENEHGKKFNEIADEWQRTKTNLAYTTAHRYDLFVNDINKYIGNRYIKNIELSDIQYIADNMATLDYSHKTIKDEIAVIKQIFKYALIKRYISNDITVLVDLNRGRCSVRREALTEDEVEIVKRSIDKPFGLLAYFLLYTGLRKGEALALSWSDIDFENNIIKVTKSIYHQINRPCIKKPKTAAGERNVLLLDCLRTELIKRHDNNDNGIIFNVDGNYMDKNHFQRGWERYQAETGLTITAHQLRHTYATILFEAGISEKDAQNLLGHADISTTHNIYTHIRQKHFNETANKLNQFVSEK